MTALTLMAARLTCECGVATTAHTLTGLIFCGAARQAQAALPLLDLAPAAAAEALRDAIATARPSDWIGECRRAVDLAAGNTWARREALGVICVGMDDGGPVPGASPFTFADVRALFAGFNCDDAARPNLERGLVPAVPRDAEPLYEMGGAA